MVLCLWLNCKFGKQTKYVLRMMKKTPNNFKCQVFWFYDRTLFVRICKQELIFKVIVSLDYLTHLMISVFFKVCKRKWGGEGVCHFIWQIGINHCFQIFRHATKKKMNKIPQEMSPWFKIWVCVTVVELLVK